MLSLLSLKTQERDVATLTVRNLDEEVVKRLRIQAAEHGRSAEAEHREILRTVLLGNPSHTARHETADRLAAFRRRTAVRDAPSGAELLQEVRADRMRTLTEGGPD